jgi:hypothetical protein
MKRVGLIVLPLMLVVLLLPILSGCSKARLDHVWVHISDAVYLEKYDNSEITAEDFEWENIKEIVYSYRDTHNESATLIIKLKMPGLEQVEAAVDYFNQLDFVNVATLCYSC